MIEDLAVCVSARVHDCGVALAANPPSRAELCYLLYEAAELEHTLMCTYLYAAFSLRDGESEGLSRDEAACVSRWRRTIISVAVEEMGHLAAVWKITSALGGPPQFARGEFPLGGHSPRATPRFGGARRPWICSEPAVQARGRTAVAHADAARL